MKWPKRLVMILMALIMLCQPVHTQAKTKIEKTESLRHRLSQTRAKKTKIVKSVNNIRTGIKRNKNKLSSLNAELYLKNKTTQGSCTNFSYTDTEYTKCISGGAINYIPKNIELKTDEQASSLSVLQEETNAIEKEISSVTYQISKLKSAFSAKKSMLSVVNKKIIKLKKQISLNEKRLSFNGIALQYSSPYYITKNRLTKSKGVIYYNGRKETYYSQKVLPGKGLKIPGRHVADDGTIRDKDGYIVISANWGYLPKGTKVITSLGPAKVYDTGCRKGIVDIYVNW